jgi:hypothetical protein
MNVVKYIRLHMPKAIGTRSGLSLATAFDTQRRLASSQKELSPQF